MNIFEDLFFCVAGVYTFMSLWNTLVVSFLKTFEIKRENLNLKSPLSEIPFSLFPLHWQLLISLSYGLLLLPVTQKLQNSCLVFSFVWWVCFRPGFCSVSRALLSVFSSGVLLCVTFSEATPLMLAGCGPGSLSGRDWRLDRECACFNWCDLEKDQIIWMS